VSGEVVESCDLWQRAADASDEAAELIAGIPGGDDGYQVTAESVDELRQAATLLEQATTLLRCASEREVQRYETWCRDRDWALEIAARTAHRKH
jgi:hypothetical protein